MHKMLIKVSHYQRLVD